MVIFYIYKASPKFMHKIERVVLSTNTETFVFSLEDLSYYLQFLDLRGGLLTYLISRLKGWGVCTKCIPVML